MSNANSNKKARTEFLNDLKRLNPKPADYANALTEAIQEIHATQTKRATAINKARDAYALLHKDEIDAFVEAELAGDPE